MPSAAIIVRSLTAIIPSFMLPNFNTLQLQEHPPMTVERCISKSGSSPSSVLVMKGDYSLTCSVTCSNERRSSRSAIEEGEEDEEDYHCGASPFS